MSSAGLLKAGDNLDQAALPFATRTMGWAVGIALIAAYVVMLMWLSPLALQDYPTHLARAIAMNDLIFHHGTRFGEEFHYRLLLVPYLLGDLGFVGAVELFGARGAAALWSALVFLSLPCAVLFYGHITKIRAEGRLLLFILSAYFATDWFFLMGFMSFRLATAMTLVTLALGTALRDRWWTPLFLVYVGMIVLGYLMHLTAIVFVAAAIGVSGLLRMWLRASTWRTEALLLAPVALMLAWHFGVAVGYSLPGDPIENPYTWGTVPGKIAHLNAEFLRFATVPDTVMMLMLGACLLLRAGRPRLRDLAELPVLEMLVLAATFLAMYVILPMGYADAWYVDVRPLALVSVFLVLACLRLPTPRSWAHGPRLPFTLVLAVLLVSGNLAYLTKHLLKEHGWLSQYRALVAAIPQGAHVLSVYTRPREGTLMPFLHADSFVTIDRNGVVPYEFTGDTANPMKYFRYVDKLYSPEESWYSNPQLFPVEWRSVARDYDFVLVTKPFEPHRIRVPVTTVAENESAALLAIVK